MFVRVINHMPEGRKVGERLMFLAQGRQSVVDYALRFHMLAAESQWNEPTLKAIFWRGLNNNILTELACRDDEATLDSLINMSIWIDTLLWDCKATQRQSLVNEQHSAQCSRIFRCLFCTSSTNRLRISWKFHWPWDSKITQHTPRGTQNTHTATIHWQRSVPGSSPIALQPSPSKSGLREILQCSSILPRSIPSFSDNHGWNCTIPTYLGVTER